jgi:hypothetical protein
MKQCAFVVSFVLAVASCADVGQDAASIPLRVGGSSVGSPISAASGWTIELTRADLAFGPLYLCAGYQAGSLCDTARAEWIETAVVNALDANAHDVGVLTGVTGNVRSWMYDLGITSLLTKQTPEPLAAADMLDGNSVRLEGVARKAPHAIPFLLAIPIQQDEATEIGASVVRKSGGDRFDHEITGDEAAFTVRFDPSSWMKDVDFEALVEDSTCAAGGPAVVCANTIELQCSSAGAIDSQRDCAVEGLACLRGVGCTDRTAFAPGSQGARAVRTALVAGVRPTFEWSDAP